MRKLFGFLFLNLTTLLGFSQELPKVVPPTPEAAQLAKFVDMPVSLYNGTPSISVPIYSVPSSSVELPISLSYHSKGVQVSEIASRTGIGWSLNAGGVITRQIRGLSDNSSGGYLNSNYIEDFQTDPNTRIQAIGDDSNGMFDYYPDLFMFNFMGYSGKFIIDQVTLQPILQKYDDLKIIINGSPQQLTSFTIITPDGTSYFFDTTESSYSVNSVYNSTSTGSETTVPLTVSSWYLSSITTAKNETISFTYEDEIVTSFDISEISDTATNDYLAYSKRTSYQKQLKEIFFTTGKVVFNASNLEREDLSGGKALDNIEIYAKITSNPTYALIKKFKLNYFYTTSTDDNLLTVYNLFKTDPIALKSKKRLFLGSVDELEVGNPTHFLRTSFEYNSTLLPNRMSNSKDSWGYFNGKNNHFLKAFYGVDRTVDTTLSEAGLLNKINHPTGGQTEFIYEHNRVIPPTYFKNLLIPYNNPITYTNLPFLKNPNNYDPNTNSYYYPFTIFERTTPVIFNVSFDHTDCQEGGPVQATCRYLVYILSDSGFILHELTRGTNSSILLNPGNYSIKIIPNHGEHHPNPLPEEFYELEDFSIQATLQEQIIPDDQELLAAGKRIKKILKKDNNAVVLEKEYFYTDQQGKSSGVPFSIPPYFDIISYVGNAAFIGRQVSGPAGPISEFAGNNLGYSMVTEVQNGNNGPLGKTEFTFTVYADQGEYYKFPYHIPIDLEWSRGMPIETRYYKYENNAYSLIKKTINTYSFYDICAHPAGLNEHCLADPNSTTNLSSDYFVNQSRFRVPSYKFGKYYTSFIGQCFPSANDPDCYRTTYFVGGKLNPKYTETFDYFSNGTFVYNKVNYVYNGTNHYQKTSETTTSSDGSNNETKYYYASEMNNTALLNKNIKAVPIKTESFKNQELLSTSHTIYKDWGNTLLAPEIIQTSKGSQTLEDRVKFNLVDNSNGNPLEVEQVEGTKICYIWGYNKSQPVAKIENAIYTQVSPYVANIQNLSDGTNEAGLISALNALRTALPKAMVTTYTYLPLKGVHTITDPKGDTITYEYDVFNRLKAVYDKDGYKLAENDYHYKTQN